MDLIRALKAQALRSVLKPDTHAYVRQIQRWYSKTFHTPLHVVEDLPLEDVLLAFYEENYWAMTPAEREEERVRLTRTKEELAQLIAEEEREEQEAEELLREMEEEARRFDEEQKTKAAKTAEPKPQEPEEFSLSFEEFDLDSSSMGPPPKR